MARQGLRFVLAGLVAGAMGLYFTSDAAFAAFGWLLASAGFAFAAFSAYFFRDPERPLPRDENKIYSPGDGRVLSVAKEGPGDVVTLRIFLSLFDVHVQRYPCSGSVQKVHYQKGSFAAAMKKEARANERCVTTIDPGRGGVVVVEQIAGLVARRIECWAKPGGRANSGERLGIIYFGSQAAVHFPAGACCTVLPGQRVVGGVTVVGEWIR